MVREMIHWNKAWLKPEFLIQGYCTAKTKTRGKTVTDLKIYPDAF